MMEAEKTTLTRGVLKTGQVTSYIDRDDGYYQAGWWKGLSVTNNKPRFIQKTIDGDDIVYDRATGLMWAADGDEAGCYDGEAANWVVLSLYAKNLTFAGYSDWRIPNINELLSIVKWSNYFPAIDLSIFVNTQPVSYWSSTSFSYDDSNAFFIDFYTGCVDYDTKIEDMFLRLVRDGL